MHEFSSLFSDSRFTRREAGLIADSKDTSRDIFIANFLNSVEAVERFPINIQALISKTALSRRSS